MKVVSEGLDLPNSTFRDKCEKCRSTVEFKFEDIKQYAITMSSWTCPKCSNINSFWQSELHRMHVKTPKVEEKISFVTAKEDVTLFARLKRLFWR